MKKTKVQVTFFQVEFRTIKLLDNTKIDLKTAILKPKRALYIFTAYMKGVIEFTGVTDRQTHIFY